MLALPLAALLATAVPPPLQDSKPTADGLAAEAWALLPPYTGDHRFFLADSAKREALAATHLLEGALVLDPGHLPSLWRLGYARNLLREDAKNRGELENAELHAQRAAEALERAIGLDAADPWAPYTLAMVHTGAGRHDGALEDLAEALARSETAIAAATQDGGDTSGAEWLRFKILEWRSEVEMRARRFETAREHLRAFHGEFSTNPWPLEIALAESCARERDLAGAREHFGRAIELFDEDSQAYAARAYCDGLLGDDAAAVAGLERAIQLERQAGLYTRLWLWILSQGEARAAAGADLATLCEGPPPHLSAWDVALARFLLGEGEAATFVEAGEAELARRIEANEAPGDLRCELHFYAGLRCELDGAEEEALHHYRAALRERPTAWKWEWAYARTRLARLAAEDLGRPTFEVIEGRFREPGLEGPASDSRWSVPGALRAAESLGRAPRAGDLLLVTVLDPSAGPRHLLRVVGVDR